MSLDEYLRLQPGRCGTCGYDLARQSCLCATSDNHEYALFKRVLLEVAVGGVVHQRDVRPKVRGRIEPKHIGQQYARAIREGLLVESAPERSNDSAGKNAGRWEPSYELRSAA